MPNNSETIRKFVKFLNNKEEQGGYWLPNIQRKFVWKEEQIEKLYDSILREYPIGTLLIWKTNSNIKRRKFIDNYYPSTPLKNYYIPEDNTKKMMVLDGQQRLQSLFIGLLGSYSGKELYINILSGDLTAPEDTKFEFKFLEINKAHFPFIKIKDLVMTDSKTREIVKAIANKHKNENNCQYNEERIQDNVELIREIFCTQDKILFQLVDSIDRPSTYTDDDIVEIFIRANSGGTQLEKSDLLFSLLTSKWENAENNIDELINDLNQTGYKFDRDFILKVCLVLLDQGAKYQVSKFRELSVRNDIEKNWNKIAESVKFIKDFVYGNTYLKTDKTLPSYYSLIPLIYSKYHFSPNWGKEEKEEDVVDYLIKVNLTGVFGGVSDNFTDSLIKNVRENHGFDKNKVFSEIKSRGKSITLSDKAILNVNYTSKEIHLLFNLWYGFNYQPTLKNNQPQIDHIFPQSKLKEIKTENPESGKMDVMKYKKSDRDQLGNLMLLTAQENGKAGKKDTLPKDFFSDKDEAYLEKHLIPKDSSLWEVDKYEEFIAERNRLILDKFSDLVYITEHSNNE